MLELSNILAGFGTSGTDFNFKYLSNKDHKRLESTLPADRVQDRKEDVETI